MSPASREANHDDGQPSAGGWSVDTLRVHVQSLIDAAAALNTQRFTDTDKAVQAALVAQEKAVAAALAAAERAVNKAEMAAEKRADAANEFRGQLADQAARLMPRSEAEQRIATVADKIDALAARVDKTEGRSGGINAGWLIIAAAITAIAAVVSIAVAIGHA